MGAQAQKSEKRAGGGGRAPQQFHYHRHYKDSIAVQRRRNRVNDDEEHEEHPHLADFLVVHHAASVDPLEGTAATRPALARPPAGILHAPDCPSRGAPCAAGQRPRHVAFRDVTVRDYAMVLGDHPCCSYGPPVTLGWSYLEYEPLDLNEYEYHHARRRPLRQLMINSLRRTALLLADDAHTPDELQRAVKEKDRLNLRRSITRGLLTYWRAEDALESAGRKLRRAVKKAPPPRYWEPRDELDHSVSNSHTSILKTLSS